MNIFLPENTVDIWTIDLDASLQDLSILSDEEVVRATKFAYPILKQRWTNARIALRRILAHYMNCSPDTIIFKYGPYGKPYLSLIPNLYFNLSHSGSKALIAVKKNNEVGIDVEIMNRSTDLKKLSNRFFSIEECKLLSSISSELYSDAFFTIWTRKEAFIKCLGLGLHLPLDGFSVNISRNQPLITSITYKEDNPSSYTIIDIPISDDYKAACIVSQPSVHPRFHYFQ